MKSVDKLPYERAQLVPRDVDSTTTRKALQAVRQALSDVPPDLFEAANLSQIIASATEELDVSLDALLLTLRVAITGSTDLMDVYKVMTSLGKVRTIKRLEHAIQKLMVVA